MRKMNIVKTTPTMSYVLIENDSMIKIDKRYDFCYIYIATIVITKISIL